jgi:hypothetical protein
VRRVVVAVAALALIAATAVLARTLAGPDPNVLAVADGCGRSDTLLQTGRAPNWTRVFESQTSAGGAPRELRRASGVVESNGMPWYSPHVSGGDTPYSHAAYDLNMDVRLDPSSAQADLIGVGNTATAGAESGEAGRLHVEREERATPSFVWPSPGDRVWMRGYWVWDCDHYQPAGERTEIHPIMALWVERKWSALSPTGETEADLFLTTDKTEAGQHADCAHKAKKDEEAFKACVAREPNYVDMHTPGAYKLVLPLPSFRRFGLGAARVRVVDMGSVNAPRVRANAGGRGIGIVFRIPADGKRHVVAKRFFAGWSLHKPRSVHYRVSVERVLIRRAMDPACLPQRAAPCGTPQTTHEDQVTKAPGEWNFYWDVAGVWSRWKPNVFRVRDGQTIRPKRSVDVYVPRGKSWRVFVWARECDWGTLALGGSGALFPCPKQGEVGNRSGDDVPGGMLKIFKAGSSAVGTHRLVPQWRVGSCPRAANPRGCYEVTIRVRRLR